MIINIMNKKEITKIINNSVKNAVIPLNRELDRLKVRLNDLERIQ